MADKPMTVADVREMLKGKKPPAQTPAPTDTPTTPPAEATQPPPVAKTATPDKPKG